MPTYRRRDSGDSWHWCKDCSDWPTERPYEMSFSKPASGARAPGRTVKDVLITSSVLVIGINETRNIATPVNIKALPTEFRSLKRCPKLLEWDVDKKNYGNPSLARRGIKVWR